MIKIITGYRDNQYYIIENEEAHKAYFLFSNPEARTVFSNGVALIGKNIQGIEPAWNESMGWNPNHTIGGDDWNDIRKRGMERTLKDVLTEAKQVAFLAEKNPELLDKKLSEAIKLLPANDDIKKLPPEGF